MKTSLNDEYAMVCKGGRLARDLPYYCGFLKSEYLDRVFVQIGHQAGFHAWVKPPDYKNDYAELGRMVATLLDPAGDHSDSYNIVTYKGGHHGFCVDNAYTYKRVSGSSPTPNEAAMRACIALRLQVPA